MNRTLGILGILVALLLLFGGIGLFLQFGPGRDGKSDDKDKSTTDSGSKTDKRADSNKKDGGQSPASTDQDAEKVVDRAIRAHGGETALARGRTMCWVLSGRGKNPGGSYTSVKSWLTSDLPDRFRFEVEMGEEKNRLLVVVNQTKGWRSGSGVTVEMKEEDLNETREEGYARYLTTLVPLRREKGMQLISLPESKYQGKAVLGVKVTLKGHDDVEMYFDKESGMFVRMKRETAFGGLTAEKDYLFSGYKEYDGGKWPTRLVELTNGVKMMEGTVESYRFPEKADQTQFVKP
jgi:hypothetical protein